MASSEVHDFVDPTEFATAIAGAKVELGNVARGPFAAGLTRIDFAHLRVQQFSERQARLFHAADLGGRVKFALLTQPGPAMLRGGSELAPCHVVRVAAEHSYFQRLLGPTRWASITMPLDDLPSFEAAVGRDLMPPKDEAILAPPPSTLSSLQGLLEGMVELARHAPSTLTHPGVARSLEQALLETLAACLEPGNVPGPTAALRRRIAIMRRFHRALEAAGGQPVYVLELARAIGVPARTLSICCHEHLGVAPKQYLTLRRMHLARQALRLGDPAKTTVTEIATEHGFWQFGRFSGDYKALFGELPSTTLRTVHR
jgi:AraC-like DNA-binding protein